MSSQSLSNYLRRHRKPTGLSQEELAILLGFESGGQVARQEMGHRKPSLQTALAYEAIYGKSVRELFLGDAQQVETIIRNNVRKLQGEIARRKPGKRREAKLAFLKDLLNRLSQS